MKTPDPAALKNEALRLTYLYPGVLLTVALALGAAATTRPGRGPTAHELDNAISGMLAMLTIAGSLALLGFLRMQRYLHAGEGPAEAGRPTEPAPGNVR